MALHDRVSRCLADGRLDICSMCDVPRITGRKQFVHQKFKHRRTGAARSARVDLLHDIHYRFPSSQIRMIGARTSCPQSEAFETGAQPSRLLPVR